MRKCVCGSQGSGLNPTQLRKLTAVFFNLFAAAEHYVSMTITHGTSCIYAMICKSSDVGEVEFLGCLGTAGCPQQSQRGRKPVGVWGKTLKR